MKERGNLAKRLTSVFVVGTLALAGIPGVAFADVGPDAPSASGNESDSASASNPDAAAGLIVTYKQDANIKKIAENAGVDTDETQKLANDADGSDISLVSLDDSQKSDDAVSALENDPRVESVERNRPIRALSAGVSDYFDKAYPKYCYYLKSEGIEKAWKSSKADGKVAVAVLDSGITMSSGYRDPDLASTVDYADAYDAIRGRKLSRSFKDTCGHGTAVSELIAAEANNGEGIAGVSYDAKVLPVRVVRSTGSGDLASLIAGYNYVLSVAKKLNVKVVNMSLGSSGTGSMASLQKLIDEAYKKGILSIAASGNEAQDGNPVEYPAALRHVVSVGAVNSKGKIAAWSEHNKHVDIAAAGVNLSVPRFWSEVHAIIPFDPWSGLSFSNSSSTYTYTPNTYAVESGTSFAAPIVSGVAALVYAADKSATAEEVENALESSATDRGAKGKDERYGHGELNASKALSELPSSKKRAKAEKSKVKGLKSSKPKIKSKARAKGSVKVGWKKLKDASGYRVYYRVKGKRTWKHVSTKKLAKTISKLKRKTSYQVRVRGYLNKLDGTKSWSKYSSTVTVKTK